MERPKLFPDNSTATQTTRRATALGIILYTVYLLIFTLGLFAIIEAPHGLDAAFDQLTTLVLVALIILIDILLPIRMLRKIYANGLTRFRTLTTLFVPTLTGIRLIYFAPIALYNIILVGYFYYQANYSTSTNTTTNSTTNKDESNNTTTNHSDQRPADNLEENAYKKHKNQNKTKNNQ